MSTRAELFIYDKAKLLDALKEWGATDIELATRILEKCGTFEGDSYLLLNNEFYDEYNPYYGMLELFEAAFGKDNVQTVVFLSDLQREGVSSIERDEIAEELGITLNSDEDDEDYEDDEE